MHPIGAALLLVFISMILFAPRRWAVMGLMGGVLYLTQAQSITIAGFNMFPTRFLELAGIYRVLRRGEFTSPAMNRLDVSLIVLSVFTVVAYGLRTTEGFFYQLGTGVDAILVYFTCRGLIHDFDDCEWFLKTFVVMLAPFFAIVWFERVTDRNLFEFMGGLPIGYYHRNGLPRCTGSFRHPSLMGSLGATFLAFYIAFMFRPELRKMALIGICLCGGLVVASNSGGPFNTAAIVILGWALWKVRARMRQVRWAIVGLMAGLALVMKAPIYYLPAKIGGITGGGGYHRSYLIEMAIEHIGQWWLAGMEITDTADWFPYVLDATGGADMTNHFLSYGMRAGIIAVILLVYLLVQAFKYVGKALHEVRSKGDGNGEVILWSLGVILAAHISNWFSISYWDQFSVVFYLQLAMLSSLSATVLDKETPSDERPIEMDYKEGLAGSPFAETK